MQVSILIKYRKWPNLMIDVIVVHSIMNEKYYTSCFFVLLTVTKITRFNSYEDPITSTREFIYQLAN